MPLFQPNIIFFDIDDTLSRDGIIAPQNQTTLQQLSQTTDIKLVIATGRSKSMIPEDIVALLDANVLDAIVCTNGQYSFDNQGIISHYPLSQQQANTIHDICIESGVVHKFDSDKHLAWSDDNPLIRAFNKEHPNSIIAPDYFKTNTVYQCSVFFNSKEDTMQDIDFASYGLKLVPWHYIGGDILPLAASKERGIRDVCHYLDIGIETAMAIGDGFNDVEMFAAVGFAVAMGDAQPDLQSKADFITGSIEENGIQQVLNPLIKR